MSMMTLAFEEMEQVNGGIGVAEEPKPEFKEGELVYSSECDAFGAGRVTSRRYDENRGWIYNVCWGGMINLVLTEREIAHINY